ncbi:MAG: hypothetical protein EOO61_10690 [Hymenobacter sp.]|nr:MAG: hypothetical protein EOO61_10690 [Hymenobacter sp.]
MGNSPALAMRNARLSTSEPAQPEWALLKGNRRGLLAEVAPSGQSVPDSCSNCGAWRSQLPTGLCCITAGCRYEGRIMPSQIEGPIAITPLTQLAEQVTAKVKRLTERDSHLSFEEKQELRESRTQLESLNRTVKWLRKQGS